MELVRYENKIPEKRVDEIISRIFPDDLDSFRGLQLRIRLDNRHLNAKELSDVLEFIYRIDGKSRLEGFNSYSKTKRNQLRISEIKGGSIELIIDSIYNSLSPQTLILIWLALKYLPNLFSSVSGALLNFSQALKNYGDYQKATLEVRRGRKEIRNLTRDDTELSELDKPTQEKLVKVLEEIYRDSPKQVSGAKHLLKSKLKEIRLKKIR